MRVGCGGSGASGRLAERESEAPNIKPAGRLRWSTANVACASAVAPNINPAPFVMMIEGRRGVGYMRYMQGVIEHRRVLLGIDDTDNHESRGTGFRARELGFQLSSRGLARLKGVSRHQLYVHPDIPYTSHNSALCLDLEWRDGDNLRPLIDGCRAYLQENAATGSDAGFCVAPFDAVGDDLVAFGRSAKATVLTKAGATAAAEAAGFHLEGVTGDHGGIIGALASVGLRKSGHDGRFVWVEGVRDLSGVMTVRQLLAGTGIDVLQSKARESYKDTDRIDVSPWPRPVLLNHKAVLLIEKVEDEHAGCEWKIVPREGTKHY